MLLEIHFFYFNFTCICIITHLRVIEISRDSFQLYDDLCSPPLRTLDNWKWFSISFTSFARGFPPDDDQYLCRNFSFWFIFMI